MVSKSNPMGPKSVAIQAGPAGVIAPDAEKITHRNSRWAGPRKRGDFHRNLAGEIAASTACHAAIKINMPLEQSKMEWLLDALAKTDCPMSCPHGRPCGFTIFHQGN